MTHCIEKVILQKGMTHCIENVILQMCMPYCYAPQTLCNEWWQKQEQHDLSLLGRTPRHGESPHRTDPRKPLSRMGGRPLLHMQPSTEKKHHANA